jgi:uncharacterized protein (DUF302 family)
MFRTTLVALSLASLPAGPALADLESRRAPGSVAETMDALVAAVEEAGATVFARVDHAEGARGEGVELPDSQLLIFGNPALGTQAMEDDIRAGLFLPLRVLVYDQGGRTQIVWEAPEELFEALPIDEDDTHIAAIERALDRLTGAAAGAD